MALTSLKSAQMWRHQLYKPKSSAINLLGAYIPWKHINSNLNSPTEIVCSDFHQGLPLFAPAESPFILWLTVLEPGPPAAWACNAIEADGLMLLFSGRGLDVDSDKGFEAIVASSEVRSPILGMSLEVNDFGSFHTKRNASPIFLLGKPPWRETSMCTILAMLFTNSMTSSCRTKRGVNTLQDFIAHSFIPIGLWAYVATQTQHQNGSLGISCAWLYMAAELRDWQASTVGLLQSKVKRWVD